MTQDDDMMIPSFPVSEAPPARGDVADAAAARETAEVQAQVVMAMRFPRVRSQALADILDDCKRYTFAQTALYSYARGGQTISDGSIHLALAMAQSWGHLDLGVRELERRDGESVVESYCWDLQKNTRRRLRFIVPHKMKANSRVKTLDDPRDIYEHIANMGARRLRSCIFGVIPSDVKQSAIRQVRNTLAIGPTNKDGSPIRTLTDRISEMVLLFKGLGVSVPLIEKYLGHKVDLANVDELVDLQGIYNSIKDGAKRSEFFDLSDDEPAGRAAELAAKIHATTTGEGK
jgi:hypothetical protein